MNPLTDRQALEALRASSKDWYSIKNAHEDTAEVLIYNEIGWMGVSAEAFMTEVKAITAPEINVRINSPGGSVFDSIAIYNTLRTHPASVTTQVDSLAASGASIIVQAGDQRLMLQHSQMMIHEAAGIAIGGSADMREYADILDRQTDIIADIYATRNGDRRSKPRFLNQMRDETWFSDSEAVDAGLADAVVAPSTRPAQTVESTPDPDLEETSPTEASHDAAQVGATLEDVTTDNDTDNAGTVDFTDLFNMEDILS